MLEHGFESLLRSIYYGVDISPQGGYAVFMYKPKNATERINHRYKISLGQLKKVIDMVENHAYCIDVLMQSQAVQKALRATDDLLLENHLKTCTASAIKKGKGDEAIKEVMEVFKKRNI